MKNLGKMYILLLFLISSLYAGSVSASLSPSTAVIGDVVTYSLKVEGSDIQEPSLYDICGENIISSGSRTNIEMIGMDYKKTRTLVYQFVARKSCSINPVSVTIDGKVEKSNSVDLKVQKQSATASRDFVLDYNISKSDLYVGESATLTLTLRQNKRISIVDNKFIPSDFKGLWKKSESQPQRTEEDGYLVTKLDYVITPQREGNITIQPAELRVASRVNPNSWAPSFMPQVQWKSYFSNEINLHVKALPNQAKLIGAFTIEAQADKTTINPNEALNVIVKVKGEGNLEDIESFKPHIDGVNVFDEKMEIANNTLSQKLVFVGDHDFTIKPFELTYFDTHTKQLKKIQTEPIKITVKGSAQKAETPLTIKKEQEPLDDVKQNSAQEETNNPLYIALALVFGILIGIMIMMFKEKGFAKKETQKFSLKDEKLLLVKLLPFKEGDTEVQEIVDLLEKNIYGSEKKELDKKRVKEIVKKYNIT